MANLFNYQQDGASYQARAVLACIHGLGNIESSWDNEWKEYKDTPYIGRWENCREQGYVIRMRAENGKQINIAFFEHRNSDWIHALEWEQGTINSPTIDTADFKGKLYKDKYDTSYSVNYGQFMEMAEWIKDSLTAFWDKNIKK